MMRAMKARRVGFLVFDGFTALDLVGPAEAFAVARCGPKQAPEPAYRVVVLGPSRRPCVAESGLKLTPDCSFEGAPALDTLLIPGGHGLREPRLNRKVTSFVQRMSPKLRRVAAVCTGIYGLAPSGLLDGRRVTTHWNFTGDVSRRFPKLVLAADELFVKDGRFYTAAGVTSGIDLALALIEEDLGPSRALAVARELVVYLKRAGGQQQFSEPLRFQLSARDRLGDLSDYVLSHLSRDLSVPMLSKKLGMSARQLTRLCKSQLGESPAALVKRLRLDESRQRLLESGATVAQVGDAVGFASADVFRRAFEAAFGVNPTAYRERFRQARRAVAR
jgi:transcriptional regulator GlxA family with amidase domain